MPVVTRVNNAAAIAVSRKCASDYEFIGRFLSWFAFVFCSCFIDCCFLLLSLIFLPPLSPIVVSFQS